MWLFVTCLLLTAPEAAVEMQTLTGDVQRGALVELSDKQLVIAADNKRVPIAAADLEQVRFSGTSSGARTPTAWIELTDGSQLVATDFAMKEGTCRFMLVDGGPAVSLPAKVVRTVRLKEQTAPLAAEWERIVARQPTADLAVIRKKDHLDFVEGVLQEVGPQAAVFRMDEEVVRIARSRLDGLVVYHAKQEQGQAAVAQVACADGTRLQAAALTLASGNLDVTTPAGGKLSVPLTSLASIDFSVGKVVYLSDLEPQAVQWQPYFPAGKLGQPLEKLFRPRRNQALLYGETAGDDGKLKLRFPGENGVPVVRSYSKGLALHSKTRMEYELPEKFRRLKALAGIDARLGNQGSVQLVIEGDGKQLLSQSVSGGDVPRPIDVDLSGVKKLVITVDFGQQFDLGDYMNLCDARLVR